MTWEGFWLPNLLQTTVFAALAALVGLLTRRWLRVLGEQLFGEQQQTTAAATTAASQATSAASAAVAAAGQAKTAGDNSAQANEAIVWLAEQLAARDAGIEDMRERIDRLLGTRARELAAERPKQPTAALLIPYAAGDDSDPTTVTGRHRLHTQ